MEVPGDTNLTASSDLSDQSGFRDRYAHRAVVCLLGFFGLTAVSGLLSDGVYHEDDLKHFLYARWSQQDARYLLDEWGRPAFTIPYALPAIIGSPEVGWHACRLLSAILSAATAWLAYQIARRYQIRHAWLVIPLIYLQPLFTRLSLTTLTEIILAFYLAFSTWLILANRPLLSAAVIALAPLTRHETVVLLPLWGLALWKVRGPWYTYALLLWAMVVHNVLGFWFLDRLPLQIFFQPNGSEQYGHGALFNYVPKLLLSSGPVVTALAVWGSRYFIRRRLGGLVVSATAVYFSAETVIYMMGAYSSGGYARFLVPICPWLAILAVGGISPVLDSRQSNYVLRAVVTCATVAVGLWVLCEIEWIVNAIKVEHAQKTNVVVARIALVILIILLFFAINRMKQCGWFNYKSLAGRYVVTLGVALSLGPFIWAIWPLRLSPQHLLIKEAVQENDLFQRTEQHLVAVNDWLYYWAGRRRSYDLRFWRDDFERADAGTLFLWDGRFCLESDINLSLKEMDGRSGWKRVWNSPLDNKEKISFLVLYERLSLAFSQTDAVISERGPY